MMDILGGGLSNQQKSSLPADWARASPVALGWHLAGVIARVRGGHIGVAQGGGGGGSQAWGKSRMNFRELIELPNYEQPTMAKHLLVLMVCGVMFKLKFPYAHWDVTGNILHCRMVFIVWRLAS